MVVVVFFQEPNSGPTLFSLVVIPSLRRETHRTREWRTWWHHVPSRSPSIRAQRRDFPPCLPHPLYVGGGGRELRGPPEALSAQGANANLCLLEDSEKVAIIVNKTHYYKPVRAPLLGSHPIL